jgi:glycosyltransferase involved in cell wall biosynthesis
MNLGFYYHVPVFIEGNNIKIPSYLGVFVDSLAENVENLFLFMHQLEHDYDKHCDYTLKNKNIILSSLGEKKPAWHRFLFPNITLKQIEQEIEVCDYFIVRSPSPLAPAFYNHFKNKTQLVYLVVGDYVKGVNHLEQFWVRKLAIKILSVRNDYQLTKVLAKTKTLVNSLELFNKYKPFVQNLFEVRTTTISKNDFYFRENTCLNSKINLLYTGRFDLAKGLIELVESVALLVKKKYDIQLNLVGWDESSKKTTEKLILKKAIQLNIVDRIIFLGKKSVGKELNKYYRNADIYVIPSYHEGFPRTIWEAMANSLPVITTNVGSIPFYLTNNVNSILINPKNVVEIEKAIEFIIHNDDIRKIIIKNANELVTQNTLEFQAKKIIGIIKN